MTPHIPVITVANRKHGKVIGAYVGRPSPLGNPFYFYVEWKRQKAIADYIEWLAVQLADKDSEQSREIDRLVGLAKENGSLTLVCWCTPKPCHADFIKLVIEERLKEGANQS